MAIVVTPLKTRKSVRPKFSKPHTSKYLRIYGKTLRELAQERGQSIYKTWSQIQDENGK